MEATPLGRATMSSALPKAVNYHNYIFDRLRPFLKGHVWEIGAGYGQYTAMLLAHDFRVLASDLDRELLTKVANLSSDDTHLVTLCVDLNSEDDIRSAAEQKPDSLLCLNVLEHIENDSATLRHLQQHLPAQTRAVFLTPAFPALYGFMDSDAGHFRRYTRKSLSKVFTDGGWQVEQSFYLNPIGGLGWFVRNRILPRKNLSLDSAAVNNDIEFFDRYLVGLTKACDTLTSSFFGQSVVVVARSETD